MSDLLEEKPVMPPQISPKDLPRDGEHSDSEDDPVPPVILENSSSSDEEADNMDDEEDGLTQGYVQLSAQEESEIQQTADHWLSQVCDYLYLI